VFARVEQVVTWTKTHEGKKISRYLFSSVITTIFSFTVISLVYGLHIIDGVIGATLFGNILAILPSYWLNRNWAWGKKGRSHFRREIVPFWTMALAGIAFSLLGATLAKHEVSAHHWSHLINTGVVAFANVISFVIFWVLKMMLFNRIFHVAEMTEFDEHLLLEEEASRENS